MMVDTVKCNTLDIVSLDLAAFIMITNIIADLVTFTKEILNRKLHFL